MEMSARSFTHIPTAQLKPDPNQPRKRFDPTEIAKLADSLRGKGVMNPISVRPVGDDFVILFGERRWLAAKRAKRQTVPCLVWDNTLSQAEILERQLVEAEHCLALDPVERAVAHENLMARRGWSQRQLAQSLGISESDVTRSLSLLKLPEQVQGYVISGSLPSSTAYEISRLPTPEAQLRLAQRAVEEELPRNRVVLIIQQILLPASPASRSGAIPSSSGKQNNHSHRAPEPHLPTQLNRASAGKNGALAQEELPQVTVTFGFHLKKRKGGQPILVHVLSETSLSPDERVEVLRRAYMQELVNTGAAGKP